jgi:hypothetical protein
MTSGSSDKTEQDIRVEYFPASNLLQAKAPFLDIKLRDVLRKADEMLALKQKDYLVWVLEDIDLLQHALANLPIAITSRNELDEIYRISHSMMGQGGTFGYPLVTYILQNLCDFLDAHEPPNEKVKQVVELHIEAVRVIISKRLSGNGGELGKQIMEQGYINPD